jgi:uncharacterized protein YcfL
MSASATRRPLLAAALLGFAAASAACRSTGAKETYVEELSIPGSVPAPNGDALIERRLAFVILDSRDVEGLKTVRFELRNVSDAALDFSWTVDWFDRGGARLAAARRTWTRTGLGAGESETIDIQAPSASARSWRLRAVDPRTLP